MVKMEKDWSMIGRWGGGGWGWRRKVLKVGKRIISYRLPNVDCGLLDVRWG